MILFLWNSWYATKPKVLVVSCNLADKPETNNSASAVGIRVLRNPAQPALRAAWWKEQGLGLLLSSKNQPPIGGGSWKMNSIWVLGLYNILGLLKLWGWRGVPFPSMDQQTITSQLRQLFPHSLARIWTVYRRRRIRLLICNQTKGISCQL